MDAPIVCGLSCRSRTAPHEIRDRSFSLVATTEPQRVAPEVPVRVLILIPTLNVGGAEMDLVRILPNIDQARFRVTVCTFLSRGNLAGVLESAGVEVIGPLSPSVHNLRRAVRRMARRILRPFNRSPWIAVAGVARQIQHWIRPALKPLLDVFCLCVRIFPRFAAMCRGFAPKSIAILLDSMRLARPIARYIELANIDIVQTILPNSYLVGACARARAKRRPSLLMSRVSLNRYQHTNPLLGLVERRLLHAGIDRAVTNSKSILLELEQEGVDRSKLMLIHNGIDARVFEAEMIDRSAARRLLEIDDGTLVFSVVANLHAYKGHEDLFLALAALSHQLDTPWVCLVAGDDPHRRLSKLVQLCRDYGISNNVRFLGAQGGIARILSACDIHVSASHEEGLPNNLIEAMCARLPVVATAVGGVPELVSNGETGFLVPSRDASRLADALLRLAISPELRKRFGEAGYRKAVTDFDLRQTVAQYQSLYRETAAMRPGRAAVGVPASLDPATPSFRKAGCPVGARASSGVTPDHPSSKARFDVGVLFFNRATQTLECIRSFLGQRIAPDIVVLDQGSDSAQREFLHNALAGHPNIRFVTLDQNIGIPAGRNRLCRECSAEWIFFVDNDVILNTQDGCNLINDALGRAAGVDGLSPLILNVHENRMAQRIKIVSQGGCATIEAAESGAEITNIFAGCAVMLRRSVLLDNPFDERLFVGFEDHELALRAFASGRALRIARLDDVIVAHKHMPVVEPADIAATKVRYDDATIARSFDVLRTAHGRELFGDWSSWVSDQRRDMLVRRPIEVEVPAERIRVMFIVEANSGRLIDLVRELAADMSGTHIASHICIRSDDQPGRRLQEVLRSRPHILHFFSPSDFLRLASRPAVQQCAELTAQSASEVLERLCRSRITFSVREGAFREQQSLLQFRPLFWLGDGYSVASQQQWGFFESLSDYPNPSAIIPDEIHSGFCRRATGSNPESTGNLSEQNGEATEQQDRAHRARLWGSLFSRVIGNAHSQEANWRRLLIEKFYLQESSH